MRFNKHYGLNGKHARLSASKSSWTNYTEEKFDSWLISSLAAQRGTELHALAHDLIRLGVKLPATKKTLNMYVNDAIGFKMKPEQLLYVSDNAFGTADAINFRRGKLRVNDLKTGVNETGERQLEIYDAFFCLEYDVKPFEIEIENRIYQNDEVRIYDPDPADILHLMDKIVTLDKIINQRIAEMDD